MVPKIAFAPLFVTWFGFGYLPKVIIVFLVCFFPILLNGILAFSSLPTRARPLLPARPVPGRWRTFLQGAPAGRPAATLRRHQGCRRQRHGGATISEWIGGDAGLGYYIQIATGDMRMDLAFAIIIVLAPLGSLCSASSSWSGC